MMASVATLLVLCGNLLVHKAVCMVKCQGTCYRGNSFPSSKKIIPNKHMVGFSYKNMTTTEKQVCYSSCLQDCRCNACQMRDSLCELLDYDRTFKPSFFQKARGYYYMDLDQDTYQEESQMSPSGGCYNGCCRSQPCLNGGTCVEQCKSTKEKFTCECPIKFTGRVCERRITECFDIRKYASPNYTVKRKQFNITRRDNDQEIPVFCSILVKSSWTLVESFSLANNAYFKTKVFFEDYPQSSMAPNWSRYRLPLDMMQYLRDITTLFVATCSFERKDTIRPDFMTAHFSQYDLMKPMTSSGYCFRVIALNVRGHEFKSITVPIWHQRGIYHPHIDLSYGICSLRVVQGTKLSEDTFGFYGDVNPNSTCLSDNTATTNWWFGKSFQ